jgi:hypothetical protein
MAIRSWRVDHLRHAPRAFSIGVLVALGCVSFLLWGAVATLWSSSADAVPAAPIKLTLKQPGGTTFTARQVGDEFNNAIETLSGYTIVRDRESGTWQYAVKGPRGGLKPSGKVVGLEAPPNVEKHLRSDVGSPTASATTSASATASASPTGLPTTGGHSLVWPLALVAVLTLGSFGVGGLALLRRGLS